MKKILLFLSFFLLGSFSLISQTILIREFLISFQGNELAIAIFYASWFFWIAVGATLIILKENLARHFLRYLIIYPLLVFLQLYLFRNLRGLAGVKAWEFFPLDKAIPFSFLLNLPLSFFTGIIFTSGCRFLKGREGEGEAETVSNAYIWESIGSFLAGCLITILFIKLVEPLNILFYLSSSYILVLLFLSIRLRDKMAVGSFFLLFLFFSSALPKKENLIKNFNLIRWKYILEGAKPLDEIYTPYQYIGIAELQGQFVFLSNGKVLEAIPDEVSGYRIAALFISMLDLPKDILILGYGSENCIKYLLEFPINSITYLIPDEAYFKFFQRWMPGDFKESFQDERLKVLFQDPRVFLKKGRNRYDLIILNLPDPSTSRLNKYFTLEFYRLLKAHLKDKGAIATKITSAENYIGTEIRNYGSSIYFTLKKVFEKIIIVPGEINWFFAGGRDCPITDDPQILAQRYRRYIPAGSTFYPEAFKSIFLKNRIQFLRDTYASNPLFQRTKLINTDKRPLSYFLNLLVLARYSNSRLVGLFKSAFLSGLALFLFPIILIFCLRLHFLRFIENRKENRLTFNAKLFQLFSGASAFSYQIILIFLFQNRFGTIFQLIGLVNSFFMLGLFLGSFLSKYLIKKIRALNLILLVLGVQILLYLVSYPLLEEILPEVSEKLCFTFYLALFLFSGIITGSSYPLAGKLLEERKLNLLNIAGNLEALDHWGACIGAMAGGLFLIPLLGIYKSFYLLVASCLFVFILFLMEVLGLNFRERELTPQRLSFPYVRTSYVLFGISIWALFTFNYLEANKRKIEAGALSPTFFKGILDIQRIEFKAEPLPHYIAYRGKDKFYIFLSKDLAPDVKGFSGPINLLLVLKGDGVFEKVVIYEARETPAYLDVVKNWLKEFKGRSVFEGFRIGENIDVVTGATITSKAIIEIMDICSQRISKAFFAKGREGSPEKRLLIDSRSIILILFFLTGTVLALLGISRKLRLLFLTLSILVLGFSFNLQLSIFHLAHVFTLNIPTVKNLSILLLTILPLILGIFFGRIYCGYLCPFGALQEVIGSTKLKLKISSQLDTRARYFKYILLSLLIVFISIFRTADIYKLEPLSNAFVSPLRITNIKILVIVSLFFSLFFLRFWCRYFCVVGAFLSLFNKIAIFKDPFLKKFSKCDLNIKNVRELDCLICNRCMDEG